MTPEPINGFTISIDRMMNNYDDKNDTRQKFYARLIATDMARFVPKPEGNNIPQAAVSSEAFDPMSKEETVAQAKDVLGKLSAMINEFNPELL